MISLLLRLALTLLLLPVLVIVGGGFSVIWAGYEGPGSEAARKRREAEKVAKWMAAHPADASRIEAEKQRRLKEETEHQAKLRAQQQEAEKQRRREEEMALEAALAIPLSKKKMRLLSEMPFPPRLADLERFEKADD